MARDIHIKDPADWVEKVIRDFIRESPENTLGNTENDKAWAESPYRFLEWG